MISEFPAGTSGLRPRATGRAGCPGSPQFCPDPVDERFGKQPEFLMKKRVGPATARRRRSVLAGQSIVLEPVLESAKADAELFGGSPPFAPIPLQRLENHVLFDIGESLRPGG